MTRVKFFWESPQFARSAARPLEWPWRFAQVDSPAAGLHSLLLAMLVFASAVVIRSPAGGPVPVPPRSSYQAAPANSDSLFPAEREIQLPKVPAPPGQAPKLQGTLIARAKGGTLELFLGADRCTIEELPKKLAGILPTKAEAATEDFSPSERGRGPALALAVDRNVPCGSLFPVLRVTHAAGFGRLWVKCDGKDSAPAGKGGFLLEWLKRNASDAPRVPHVVDIARGGELYVNGSKAAPAKVEKTLTAAREADPEDFVIARPHASTPFEKLAAVWELVARTKLPLVDPAGTFDPTVPEPTESDPSK